MTIRNTGANHLRHTAIEHSGVEKQILMAAYRNLPELAQKSVRVKTTIDLKKRGPNAKDKDHVRSMRRYLVPVQYGNDIYILKLSGKEIQGNKVEIDDADIRLYDQTVAKRMSGYSSNEGENPLAEEANLPTPTVSNPDISWISVGQMAENVNNKTDGNVPYLTPEEYAAMRGGKSDTKRKTIDMFSMRKTKKIGPLDLTDAGQSPPDRNVRNEIQNGPVNIVLQPDELTSR